MCYVEVVLLVVCALDNSCGVMEVFILCENTEKIRIHEKGTFSLAQGLVCNTMATIDIVTLLHIRRYMARDASIFLLQYNTTDHD